MNAEEKLKDLRERTNKSESSIGKPDFTKPLALFTVDVVDERGERYKGTFRSKVPDRGMRHEIGLLCGELARGVPWESIPTETRYNIVMEATLAVCLVQKPDWFKDTGKMYGSAVIEAVHEKVLEHQETFFRSGKDKAGGTKESTDSRG